ncbi:terminase small subunit [Desulfovibrio cuneatus]|uniref:terminase small subunit n=1 Tax=Desulfovibrio cuneatus TaxID=159728 RepID=UPI000423EDBC|nr:terminase small subunit [Desulfovibrio cuneatus]
MSEKQSKTSNKPPQPATRRTNVPEGGASPPSPQPRATLKQQAFAKHYLACHNPTQAALLAGYAAQRAPHTGTKLLTLAGVQALLHRAKAEVCAAETHKENLTKETPLSPCNSESIQQANAVKPAKIASQKKPAKTQQGTGQKRLPRPHPGTAQDPQEITGNRVLRELAAIGFASMADFCHWSTEGIELLHSGKLTKEQTAAIAEISESSTGKGAVRIKTHAKLKALEMLGRHLGIFGADPIQQDKEDPCGFSLPEDLARQLETILPTHIPHQEENDDS